MNYHSIPIQIFCKPSKECTFHVNCIDQPIQNITRIIFPVTNKYMSCCYIQWISHCVLTTWISCSFSVIPASNTKCILGTAPKFLLCASCALLEIQLCLEQYTIIPRLWFITVFFVVYDFLFSINEMLYG